MGIEYSIKCNLPEFCEPEMIISKLNNPTDQNGWSAFTVSVAVDGFYFCDNGWSETSTKAFRELIDFALMHSSEVIINDF